MQSLEAEKYGRLFLKEIADVKLSADVYVRKLRLKK